MTNNRSPFDVPAANECSACRGRGYTEHTAQVTRQTPAGPVTVYQGSGCSECFGVGRISSVRENALVDVK